MDEERNEIEKVEVRHRVAKQRRRRPEESHDQFRRVVEVPRDAPVAGQKEDARSSFACLQLVLGSKQLRLSTPDEALSIRPPYLELLSVGQVVDETRGYAEGKNRDGKNGTETDGVRYEKEADRRVDARNPHQATPADVESGAVDHDVDGTHVPRLPPEELGDVDELNGRRYAGTIDEAVQFVVFDRERTDEQRPDGHAETAVRKHLYNKIKLVIFIG